MGQAASRQEAFWEACGFGHITRVQKFIADGIDVNWVSYTHDCCPIHVASQGKPEIVKLLLEQNCDVNVTDIRGNTPLHHAAMKGHADIMQTLISAGCKSDTQDKNGWTALHNAAYWCHYKSVKVLLKNKCEISITNKDSRTALHEVARSKEKEEITLGEIARLLIEAGSNINARGSDLGEADFTGLMFASYHGHTDVASAFIEAGCDINACGASNNWSALHWAADRSKDELVFLLLESGVDPSIKAYRGETAADRAKSPEIKETIRNAINMFEELKGLDINVSQAKSPSNTNISPIKNRLTNQMVDNIFNTIPPLATRPSNNPTQIVNNPQQTPLSLDGTNTDNTNNETSPLMTSDTRDNKLKAAESSAVKQLTNENTEITDRRSIDPSNCSSSFNQKSGHIVSEVSVSDSVLTNEICDTIADSTEANNASNISDNIESLDLQEQKETTMV